MLKQLIELFNTELLARFIINFSVTVNREKQHLPPSGSDPTCPGHRNYYLMQC
jgi:hypothetical protein